MVQVLLPPLPAHLWGFSTLKRLYGQPGPRVPSSQEDTAVYWTK